VIHFDSTFFVDLLRETGRGRPGGAFDFIETLNDDEVLAVSVHVICELRLGAELSKRALAEHEAVDRVLSNWQISYPDDRFAPMFGRLLAATHRSGRPVASMDLLIATAAVLDDAALVTRNVKDFSRVPGLRTLSY
jgi:predicted nucleic acid-binding protein